MLSWRARLCLKKNEILTLLSQTEYRLWSMVFRTMLEHRKTTKIKHNPRSTFLLFDSTNNKKNLTLVLSTRRTSGKSLQSLALRLTTMLNTSRKQTTPSMTSWARRLFWEFKYQSNRSNNKSNKIQTIITNYCRLLRKELLRLRTYWKMPHRRPPNSRKR